jgi:hypothetical protein
MQDVIVTVAGAERMSDAEKLEVFKKEVDDFSLWMSKLPDWKYQGALTRAERVLLITYLVHKSTGKIDEAVNGS